MAPTGVHPEYDSTYGCLFFVAIFSTALWALSCLQLWFYIEKYLHTDALWLKLYTIVLWILSTVYLILVLKFLYIYFVKEFGNVAALDNLPKRIYGTAPFSPVICAMVQALFVMRAWNLSNRNYLLSSFLSLAVLAQLVSTVLFIHKLRNFDRLSDMMSIITYERAMNIIAVCTGTIIALSIIRLLWRHRCGFRRGDGIIKKLVAFTIGSGLITGVMATLAFITAQVLPQTFIYLLADFCMAKLYYNCMLALLNARRGIRKEMDATIGLSINLDDIECASEEEEEEAPAVSALTTLATSSVEGHDSKATECRVDTGVDSQKKEACIYEISV